MHPIRIVAAYSVLFTLGLLAGGAWAKNNVPISGTHGPGEIRQTCENNGGTYYSGGPGGSYGCQGQKGSVSCEATGKCKGSCAKCGVARQSGGGDIKGILQPPNQVGNAPPKGTAPPKGKVGVSSPGSAGANKQPGGTTTMMHNSGGGKSDSGKH